MLNWGFFSSHKCIENKIAETLHLFIWSWDFCSVILMNVWILFPPLRHWLPIKITSKSLHIQFSNHTHKKRIPFPFPFSCVTFQCFVREAQEPYTNKHTLAFSGFPYHKIFSLEETLNLAVTHLELRIKWMNTNFKMIGISLKKC